MVRSQEISGTRTGTAWDCLYRSGPGPDPVQMVPCGTFIPGHVDAVRRSRGGWAGGEGGMARCRTCQSHPLPCSAQSVATDGQLWDSGGGEGGYFEEAAGGADHEAGLVEACDVRRGIARGAADKVHTEELHVGHGAERRVKRAHLVQHDLHTCGEHRARWGKVK